jgi:hypothetical protein
MSRFFSNGTGFPLERLRACLAALLASAALLAFAPPATKADTSLSWSPWGNTVQLWQQRAKADRDNDGLSNWVEVNRTKTNPRKADTDGDGLRDSREVRRTRTSPTMFDTDRDRLSDRVEVVVTKTNPRRADTDGDGVGDAEEVASAALVWTPSGNGVPAAGPPPSSPGRDDPTLGEQTQAIWNAPEAAVHVAVTLDGTASTGAGPLECTWSFENPSGTIVWQTRRGCVIGFTFDEAGPKYVRLIVEGADGASHSNKQTIEVAEDSEEPPSEEPSPPDTTAPDTSIAAAPPATTTETTASFSFAATESGSSFACRLDSGSWGSCTSPRTYSNLALGPHSFAVRATDAAGNTDPSPAQASWTVQAPPDPEPEEPPAGPTFYIRDGGTSSACTSWAEACDALPSSLQRGATYYVASGSYPGRTFSTAASGSQTITIRGATAADHGTGAGWSSSYSVDPGDGGSQAVWTSGLQFRTSNWVFDGAVGPRWSKSSAAYGFKVNPTAYAIRVYNTSAAIENISLSHIAATAPGGDIEKFFLSTHNETKSVNRVTLSHSLLDGWSNAVWATSAGLQMDGWLIEHNAILNGFSSAANHGEDINNNYGHLDNLTVRYNLFEGREGSTGCIVVLNGPAGPYYIYGNVFKDMEGGDGIITGVHYTLTGAVYNNSFINVDNGYGDGAWIGHDVGASVTNNVVYDSVAAFGTNFTGTRDYNAYFSTTQAPSEAHRYTAQGNPFTTGGFELTDAAASAMPAGTSLSSPFHLDALGTTRGADGKWDRGAFERG